MYRELCTFRLDLPVRRHSQGVLPAEGVVDAVADEVERQRTTAMPVTRRRAGPATPQEDSEHWCGVKRMLRREPQRDDGDDWTS